jgi:diaminopimelate epimerase
VKKSRLFGMTFFLTILNLKMINFSKYQGTGNDFVMIDNRSKSVLLTNQAIANICDRRFGVGADGLIILEDSDKYDFEMKYFNADGKEGSMCGNGGRCAVQFANDLGLFSDSTQFMAVDGLHEAQIIDSEVRLGMISVIGSSKVEDGYFLNTGSPHFVKFVDDVESLDVKNLGKSIRYSDYWVQRGGVNVNFVQILDSDKLFVRTYERGVEDETYSCGTGVTAAAIISNSVNQLKSPVKIKTLGGELKVSFEKENNEKYINIFLQGPAKYVFSGNL